MYNMCSRIQIYLDVFTFQNMKDSIKPKLKDLSSQGQNVFTVSNGGIGKDEAVESCRGNFIHQRQVKNDWTGNGVVEQKACSYMT